MQQAATCQEDEIEIIDLQEYNCSGKLLPKLVKYYLIKVDDEKIRVQSPISATEVLIASYLDPKDYRLKQIFTNDEAILLELDQEVDLREKGVERFETVLAAATNIIINGREKLVTDKVLTFSELIQLAFENPPHGSNVCFTVTYRKGPKKNTDGTMIEGDSVKIKKGMVFNVTATDKS